MNMRKLFVVMLLLFAAPALSIAQSTSVNQLGNNTRLLQHPEWDGALVSGNWFDAKLRYQDWDDLTAWMLTPTFATTLSSMPKLELGSRLYLFNMDPDEDIVDDGFFLGDIDVWGKYQFFKDTKLEISGGLLLTLPLGDEGAWHQHATGEFNFELFGGARYHVSDATAVVGHVGIRKNSDMDLEYNAFSRGGLRYSAGTIEADGETQFQLSLGTLHQLNDKMSLNAELSYASNPYDVSVDALGEDDIRFTAGAEYALSTQMALAGGIGFGLDDAAPDYDIILGLNYLF